MFIILFDKKIQKAYQKILYQSKSEKKKFYLLNWDTFGFHIQIYFINWKRKKTKNSIDKYLFRTSQGHKSQ